MNSSEKKEYLTKLVGEYKDCERCQLGKKATHKVFGCGSISKSLKIMFIGIGPGEKEDEQGRPFVGDSGVLLRQIIKKSGLEEKEVYFTNLVLCRPFEKIRGEKKSLNRDPIKAEVTACLPRLLQEIYIVDPPMIVLLGKPPVMYLTSKMKTMSNLRGTVIDIVVEGGERRVIYPAIPTWHPAYLLRNDSPIKDDPLHQAVNDVYIARRLSRALQKRYSELEENNG